MKKYTPIISDKETKDVEECISNLLKDVKAINSSLGFEVYNNDTVCKALNVTYKLLSQFRNEGLLPYSKIGDKYWYTNSDINYFIKSTQNI